MTGFVEYESYDAVGLADLVHATEVQPLDLLEACLARIEERNPRLNAVVHVMAGLARTQVETVRPEQPLAGVPFLLKDLLAAVAGQPLTASSRFLAAFVPDHDSELVTRLRGAGLVFAGKTNTPELGIMGVTEPRWRGPTRNPWNLAYTPGGSSGGSAAAVAAGIVPAAHGGDGGGSIRIPASCCGLFGLKPSHGRNPLGPDVGECWAGQVQEHAITRTVRDSAALLDATCGPDLGAVGMIPRPVRPFLEEVGRNPGRLRIAFTTASVFGDTTHAECRVAAEDVAALCGALGHQVDEAHPPVDKGVLRWAYLAIVAVGTARTIAESAALVERPGRAREFEPETWMLGLIGRSLPAHLYQEAIDQVHSCRRRMAAFFQSYDVLLTPTLAYPPVPIGSQRLRAHEALALAVLRTVPNRRALRLALERMAAEKLETTANTMLFNQTGQPAMSVPLSWSNEGLPIGTQFVARYGEEALLFRLGAQLEAARPWVHRRPPGFSDLAASPSGTSPPDGARSPSNSTANHQEAL